MAANKTTSVISRAEGKGGVSVRRRRIAVQFVGASYPMGIFGGVVLATSPQIVTPVGECTSTLKRIDMFKADIGEYYSQQNSKRGWSISTLLRGELA